MRHAWPALWFLLASTGLAALAGCDRKPAEPPPVRPVLSMVVQRQTSEAADMFTGTVQPRYRVDLGFQTSGRMILRTADVGDTVKKGDKLAALDATLAQQALVSAQADVVNAEAVLRNAKATFARKTALARTGSGSRADLDSATASRDTAIARVNQALANRQKAIEELGYTELISGYDGVIVAWHAEIGQVVSVGQPIVTVARPEPRDAVFDIPDDRVDRFPPGAVFQVSLLAEKSITAKAAVREIAPQSDTSTGTQRIRLTLEDPPEAFRLGTTIRLKLLHHQTPRIEIPANSVLHENGETSVWLVGPGDKVIRRRVVLGAVDNGLVTVTDGLSDGERLITAGIHSLVEGQAVKAPSSQKESS